LTAFCHAEAFMRPAVYFAGFTAIPL